MDIDDAARAFSALSQNTRLNIMALLAGPGARAGGLPAGDIALALGVPQNTLSFHLAHLEAAGLVSRRRAGRFVIYSANSAGMKDLLRYMIEHCCAEGGGL